jgi:hypothetical protein
LPASIHVAPGEHGVTMTTPGNAAQQRAVQVHAGGERTISFTEPEATAEREAPAPAAPVPAAPQRASGGSALTTGGWIAIGAAVVLGGTAVGLGVGALDAKSEFEEDETKAEPHDRAASLRLWANVAAGGAILVGAAGVTMLVVAPPSQPAVSLGIGPGSVRIAGTF